MFFGITIIHDTRKIVKHRIVYPNTNEQLHY